MMARRAGASAWSGVVLRVRALAGGGRWVGYAIRRRAPGPASGGSDGSGERSETD